MVEQVEHGGPCGKFRIAVSLAGMYDEEVAGKVLRMIEALDEHDDTKNVYANHSIADDILAKLEDDKIVFDKADKTKEKKETEQAVK